MGHLLAIGLIALGLLSGCAGAQMSDSRKDTCEKSGGYWQGTADICERPRS